MSATARCVGVVLNDGGAVQKHPHQTDAAAAIGEAQIEVELRLAGRWRHIDEFDDGRRLLAVDTAEPGERLAGQAQLDQIGPIELLAIGRDAEDAIADADIEVLLGLRRGGVVIPSGVMAREDPS